MNVPQKIEQAMQLVIAAFAGKTRIGRVSVPQAAHSIRVGLSLLARNCEPEVGLGGFCHDLLEDTHVTTQEILILFGGRVVDLAQLCTIDPVLGNNAEGEAELCERNIKIAEGGDCDSLIIKCEDSLDNLRTNLYLKQEWQVSSYHRGVRWLEAAQRFGALKSLEEDLALMLWREKVRLRSESLI